ncbi:hypothetical protein VUR80DRAFT_9123 [Thermomyces stellatus]
MHGNEVSRNRDCEVKAVWWPHSRLRNRGHSSHRLASSSGFLLVAGLDRFRFGMDDGPGSLGNGAEHAGLEGIGGDPKHSCCMGREDSGGLEAGDRRWSEPAGHMASRRGGARCYRVMDQKVPEPQSSNNSTASPDAPDSAAAPPLRPERSFTVWGTANAWQLWREFIAHDPDYAYSFMCL